MQIKIRDEKGIEEVLYEYKSKYEPSKSKSSIFSVIWDFCFIIAALIGIVTLIYLLIISLIYFLMFFPYSLLLLIFIFILIIFKTEIETIIIDKGFKTVIITYNHDLRKSKSIKAIKFPDIKEIKIEDAYNPEGEDIRNINLVKKNGNWYSMNWLRESVDINQFTWDMGILMSKIIGVNCYYIDKDKKSTMLYKAIHEGPKPMMREIR